MKSNVSDVRKRIGRPPVGAKPVTVRLPPDQLAKVDQWRESQDDKPTRPEAIRRLVEKAL